MRSQTTRALVEKITELMPDRLTPLLVALDGRSGAGKSTLAAAVAFELDAAVINGDDFYAGGNEEMWDAMSAAEKVAHCIDWRRQVPALEGLRAAKRRAGDHTTGWPSMGDKLTMPSTVVRKGW